MNFVYPLGKGTVDDNIELRISLRSIAYWIPEPRKIFIVGECPEWATNVIHIPFPDRSPKNKDGNMIAKVMEACNHPDMEDVFVRMSDDQVLINPNCTSISGFIDVFSFTPVYNGNLSEKADPDPKARRYRRRVFNTYQYLLKNGYSTYNYDTHAPVQITKKVYLFITEKLALEDYTQLFFGLGYLINSIYFNQIIPAKRSALSMPKNHALRLISKEFIDPSKYTFLNYNNDGFTKKLRKWLLERYPDKSKYEK
jgi:hypothetical protein